MIPNIDILQAIWERSKPGWHFLATMHRPNGAERGKYTDYPMPPDWQAGEADAISDQPHEHDLFFAPLAFAGYERHNSTVRGPGVLFADLDRAVKPEITPSVYWETSSGNTQAVWFLEKPMEDYKQWADLNRRMTKFTRADPGGWMGSKVLRVPGSVNWKRRDFGRLLSFTPNLIDTWQYFSNSLPDYPRETRAIEGMEIPVPALLPADRRNNVVKTYWDSMTLLGRSMVTQKNVRDRSLHIVRTAHELRRGGLNDVAIFHLLWTAPWCKWRTDRYSPERLWAEVLRTR